MTITATYSVHDNKIRIDTGGERITPDAVEQLKAAGFRWAPRAQVWFAPRWTPAAEDAALAMAGDIEDDTMTREERAADRAERFRGHADSQTEKAQAAQSQVARISDAIPFGQPILVGHHSERRARKDSERIHAGMKRAIDAWDTVAYWKGRAEASLRHASRMERPDVRARRIKKLGAEKRSWERELTQAMDRGGDVTRPTRWLRHVEMRLTYEQVMSGPLPSDEVKPEKGGAIQCWASGGAGRWAFIVTVNKGSVSIWDNWDHWGRPTKFNHTRSLKRTIPFDKIKGVMTSSDVKSLQVNGLMKDVNKCGFAMTEAPAP